MAANIRDAADLGGDAGVAERDKFGPDADFDSA